MTPRSMGSISTEQLWSLVPGWTRAKDQEGLLRALVEALGVGLDAVRDDVLRLLDDMFVETCDPRLVPLIGDLVGVSIDPAIPVVRQRHLVKYAVHLRRRRGTAEHLETLGWQITGFETSVRDAHDARWTARAPLRAVRLNGVASGVALPTAVRVSGALPIHKVEVTMRVVWPVRRAQIELTPVGPDVHAVDPRRAVGLRHADGTPILRRDPAGTRVSVGRVAGEAPIEVNLIGADFAHIGRLTPRFMNLPDNLPIYVPARTLAIDPERGRVAGPTAPSPGIRAYRRYRIHFWEPLRAELVSCVAATRKDGVFTFAADGSTGPLTDPNGVRLLVGIEGEHRVPRPSDASERLLVVRSPGHARRGEVVFPFVLLGPGVALDARRAAVEQGIPLDVPGLGGLFSIEDEWGWDICRNVRFVDDLSREAPPDHTVQVDVARGRFRVSPAWQNARLSVRYHRPYDLATIKRRGEDALRNALPLGCSARIIFRDTAPGSTEVSP